MATHLSFTSLPAQVNDPTYSSSVIASHTFSVQIAARNADGSVDLSYNGVGVTLYADNGSGGYPYALGISTFTNGYAKHQRRDQHRVQ